MQEMLSLYRLGINHILRLGDIRYGERTHKMGSSEGVQVVKSKVLVANRAREVALVIRDVKIMASTPDIDKNCINKAEKYYQVWRRLKAAGLPVVDTVRLVSPDQVALSDVTRNGAAIYDKYTVRGLYHGFHKPHPNDETFKDFDLSDVEKEALQIAARAEQHDIGLALDDPLHLVYERDQTWRLMMLDIGQVRLDTRSFYVKGRNGPAVNDFMDQLHYIQDTLRKDYYIGS